MTIRRGPVATDRLTAIERALPRERTNERTNAMKNTGAAADTPGSKASVDFWNRFVALPSTADVKEMSPREADEVLSELGRAMSESCARGGCDHVGEWLVAMPKQNLKEFGKLLLELALTRAK